MTVVTGSGSLDPGRLKPWKPSQRSRKAKNSSRRCAWGRVVWVCIQGHWAHTTRHGPAVTQFTHHAGGAQTRKTPEPDSPRLRVETPLNTLSSLILPA